MTEAYPVVAALCREGFPLAAVCAVLAVSRSAYYAYRQDRVTRLKEEDQMLKPLIRELFRRHKRRYGARRIAKQLAAQGVACGPRRAARLLRELKLQAIQPKSFKPRTTDSRHTLGYSPNLLADAPEPQAMNRLWVADITYIPLPNARFAYAALVMDRYSRRIVGWDVQPHMQEALPRAALQQALRARRPAAELIHHSDRGGQYAGGEYRRLLTQFRLRQSMSRAANCYDNAFMESCFGTIKTELEMEQYASLEIARKELAAYIRYYNTQRLHSALDYRTPLGFEQRQAAAGAAGKTAARAKPP